MKKFTVILLLIAIFASFTVVHTSAENLDYVPGDVDNNGIINMLDVLMLAQYYVDGCKYDPDGYGINIQNINAGDVDGNGIINMLDVLTLVQYFVDGCKYDPNGYAIELKPGNFAKELTFVSNGDGTCYVSSIGTFNDNNIVIPEKSPDGDTVTGIGNSAFEGCDFIVKVYISKGVKSIGNNAFKDCSNLDAIYYGGSAKEWYAITLGTDWDKNITGYTIFVIAGGDNVALNDPFNL